ncbi:hypothetical protein HanOQP8_Chr03g0094121 [Helianthus annuus]|nr:hypothetical protein HanIR_Chr03g0106481 [Helianthus annuus]KAJ0773021.1 hypothetical protein HanOQP8_Chr03g0094121 [Helianthus annuus]
MFTLSVNHAHNYSSFPLIPLLRRPEPGSDRPYWRRFTGQSHTHPCFSLSSKLTADDTGELRRSQ